MRNANIKLNEYERLFLDLFDYSPDISPDDVYNCVKAYYYKVYSNLNIGEIILETNTPNIACSTENNYFRDTLIRDNPGNGRPYIFNLSFNESSFIKITFYPKDGYEFNNNIIDRINIINKHIFDFYGRSRCNQLLKTAPFLEQLTKGPNQNGAKKVIYEYIKNQTISNYVSIFSNIKNFKLLNNLYGHENGEKIIFEYYKTLDKTIGKNGFAARLGGDNFFIIVKKEILDEVLEVLKKMVLHVDDNDIEVESCCGYYYIKPEDTYHNIIDRANLALKYAKEKYHSSKYEFSDADILRINKNFQIKHEVMAAMKVKNLITYYQPKVELTNYKLCGCEALVRWKKDGKIVGPGEFIPVLETENMILDLDYYILELVCCDIRKWLNMGLDPVRVSINFSMAHITEDHSIEKIMAIINKYDIDTKYIEIELTEMTDVYNVERFINYIAALKKNGILVSMDDFGTGFASLSTLKTGNYDIVKIDKSVINKIDIVDDSDIDIIFLKYTVKLLNELKKIIICEGVERESQLIKLKEIGCNEIQGYYFDKPLQISEYEKRLINKQY